MAAHDWSDHLSIKLPANSQLQHKTAQKIGERLFPSAQFEDPADESHYSSGTGANSRDDGG